MDYRKFMQNAWIDWEDEILDFFKTHSISDFKKCAKVCKGMVYEGGDLQTERIQGWHLWNYHKHTGKSLHNVKSFIEVGGGYGMMCKIIKSCNDAPYNIIDLSIINRIQKYFLYDIKDVHYIGLEKLESTSNLALDLFNKSITSFLRKDIKLANQTIESVHKLELGCKEINKLALKQKSDIVILLGYIIDSIRRIGEYSSDISENVINHFIGEEKS